MNDFEYDSKFCPWRPFKHFMEGEGIKAAVPKNEGSNYWFDGDGPVFGTAPGLIEHPTRANETAQMTSRVRYFIFRHFFSFNLSGIHSIRSESWGSREWGYPPISLRDFGEK